MSDKRKIGSRMSLLTAFSDFQRDVVNAEKRQMTTARERRDAFVQAFKAEDDTEDAFCSGSLRRLTHLRPIHDVDVVVVYERDAYPTWGAPGPSSEQAMSHVKSRVDALLGSQGSRTQLVRMSRLSGRGRSVKCFIDTTDTNKADAFTVDVMPVLRQDDQTLILPSQIEKVWSTADPEYLIRRIADKQSQWDQFCPTVRLLKLWAREQVPTQVKSLVMEVLALHHLPTTAENVPAALRRFFTAAAATVSEGVEDPAGYCGPIQIVLDHEALRKHLAAAADAAQKASAATAANNQAQATTLWQSILGPEFAPGHSSTPPAAASAAAAVVPRPIRDAPQG
jgi:hypothetical protein